MPAAGVIKFTYLAYLAKPSSDRSLYRLLKNEKVCRIVELGIGSLPRVSNLIAVAQRFSPNDEIHYTAVDWFDMRASDLEPLKLIEAHRVLKSTGVKVRLLPGDPGRTLRDVANSLPKTDLIVIHPAVTDSDLANAWYYLPRMCHPRTTVLRAAELGGEVSYRALSFGEIAERSVAAIPARAA